MKSRTFQWKLASALLVLLVFCARFGFGRQPNVVIRPAPAQPAKQDPFDMLISSAASFDMDSPVTAKAEFDPPVAVVGQSVVYRVEVTALDESLKMPNNIPALSGTEFREGGHAQTYQHNGSMKLQPHTTYVYHLIAPATGNLTMPAFDILAYGKPVKVPPATLTIVPKGEIATEEPTELLINLPPGDLFVGQLLRVQLLLPDTGGGRVHGFNKSHIDGEFIFSEPIAFGMRREPVQHDGQSLTAFVDETEVTPLRAGPQKIVAGAYAFLTRPMLGVTNVLQSYLAFVDSEPVTLNVKPLPTQGRLPGFTDAVGSFHVDPPRLSTDTVRAGEPLTLTVTFRGDGNVGRMAPPPAPRLPDWQIFAPTAETIPPSFIQQRGFVNFSYTLIPLNDKSKATPAIPFCYFDPTLEKYVDLTVSPVPLTVAPGLNETNNASLAESDNAANAEPEPVLTGLESTPGRVTASILPVQQRAWFLSLQLIPAAILCGLWFWSSRRRYHELHPEIVLKRRGRRGLRRQLRLARRAAESGDTAGFVTSAANALREASAPHTAANPQALVCADVLRELPESQQKNGKADLVRKVFAATDALRFGNRDHDNKDLLVLCPELEQLLARMKERLL